MHGSILECPPAGWAQLLHPLSQVDAAPCALHGSFETCSFMVFRWEAAQRVTRCNRSETFFPGSQGDEPPPKSARLPHLLSSHSGGGWLPVGSIQPARDNEPSGPNQPVKTYLFGPQPSHP